MHLHFLGISGTFMSGLAILARAAGIQVTGSDTNCYPPISDLLASANIAWTPGYDDTTDALKADLVIVGNVMRRGMPVLDAVLEHRKPYTSGPQWLAEYILPRYQVLAVAGTHGKTTTASMSAFILDYCGYKPGFLIGGVVTDFNTNARLAEGDWFVIEADEYDSAFFDKRPKFMHYRPAIAVLNNLEFDHADIYADLAAIQTQMHYFLKTIRPSGHVLYPRADKALSEVMALGTFSQSETLGFSAEATWQAQLLKDSGEAFRVLYKGQQVAEVHWDLIGQFNVENALAALAACTHAGVEPNRAAEALTHFTPVKRRLEVKSAEFGVTVYDDFAHHPTAIEKTIIGLRQSGRHQRILVVIEFASYTMRTGVHGESVAAALAGADAVYIYSPEESSAWLHKISTWRNSVRLLPKTEAIVSAVAAEAKPGDAVLVMSNRGFELIHARLTHAIHQALRDASTA